MKPSLLPVLDVLQPDADHDAGDLIVDGGQVGRVAARAAHLMARAGAPFIVTSTRVEIDPGLADPSERTRAVALALDRLVRAGDLPPPHGEAFPVLARWGEGELMRVDRAHVPLLGITAFGLHVNGYREGPAGLEMWIARRAADRLIEPGKLDNLVGGGQPAGIGLADNLRKEAAEEAGVGADLAARARPAGLVSYQRTHPLGLRRDVLFVYDLLVDDGFEPVNTDGEVDGFSCHPIAEVLDRLRHDLDAFKFNVPLVIVDFCIRYGTLDPDREPDYVDLVQGLRLARGVL